MRSMRQWIKTTVLTFLIVLLSWPSSGHGAVPETLNQATGVTGISFPQDREFKIDLFRELDRGFLIKASNNGMVLKLNITMPISEMEAREHARLSIKIIRSLYQALPSPYPGMISQAIQCPPQYQPQELQVETELLNLQTWLVSATNRLTYGACDDGLIGYHGVLSFIYRPEEKTLYRLELFYPKDRFTEDKLRKFFRDLHFAAPGQKPVPVLQAKDASPPESHQPDGGIAGWKRPGMNLILIALEPLGANHLRTYGYGKNTAPALERFAKSAFVFKQAISSSSWTLPSFMTWFTSLHPSQHRIVNKYEILGENKLRIARLDRVSPETVTLTQVLKNNGYSTGAFTGGAAVSGQFGFDIGFDKYWTTKDFGGLADVLPPAQRWVEKHDHDKFFLFVQGFDVHGRFESDISNKAALTNPPYPGRLKGTVEEYWQMRNAHLEGRDLNLSEEDILFLSAVYDAKIRDMDEHLGRFFHWLEKNEWFDRTIVVISSGSGNSFGEYGRFDHGLSLYDEVIRVPLIIRIPDRTGGEINSQVRTLDLMPTLVHLLGLKTDEKTEGQMKGVNFVPLINGHEMKLDAFSETDYLMSVFLRSLRTSNGFKYIYSMDSGAGRLFNLNSDQHELNDISADNLDTTFSLERDLLLQLSSMRRNGPAE